MATKKLERRACKEAPVTSRDEQDKSNMVTGYASVFFDSQYPDDTAYQLTADIVEHIEPHAFDRCLTEKQAVRCLVNHDSNFRLGRCDKGTLSLRCDSKGLRYECVLPDTQVGRDVAADLANGNLDGSSFSFAVRAQDWQDMPDGSTIRRVKDVDLFDVGPVSFPAYAATTAGLRSTETVDDVVRQRDEWRESRKAEAEKEAADKAAAEAQAQRDRDAVQIRLRLMEIANIDL